MNVRYSFANAKLLHMDIYKELCIRLNEQDSAGRLTVEQIAEMAMLQADAAVALLEEKGMIGKGDVNAD